MRRVLLLLLLLLPGLARAQGDAVLVADRLLVTADGLLIADGNVQASYEGTTLSAARITYDREADRLSIEGPILLRDPDGTILTAERAEIDPRLEDGLLTGARLVLDRQLQLTAGRIDRVGGTLTALTQAAVTSCQVCAGRPPIWEIRAERVVHDEVARQLYFDRATFHVRGIPILWLPRLRLPDPTNTRATGLLIPSIRTTDRLGAGLRLPYFVTLGAARDLTLTPYLSSRTRTLEARYRQAFLAGDLTVEGALSGDGLTDDGLRGFASVEGGFEIIGGARLAFSGIIVSDAAYLEDYGRSDDDRLESTVAITRVRERSLLRADLSHYRSLREDEVGGSLPPVVGSLSWDRRYAVLGGTLALGAEADGFVRPEEGPAEAARDMARAGLSAGWRRRWTLGAGLLVEANGRGALDAYRITDDPDEPTGLLRAVPAAAVTLRWPLLRRGGDGASDLIEPVASLGWTAAFGGTPPNEDGLLVEFDEANLHALTRFPGEDAVEEGGRVSLGLAWTRSGEGFASSLALGRVVRTRASDASEASGLAGTTSDLLLVGRLDLAGGFALNARTLLGGAFTAPDFGKSEARVDWSNDAVGLSAAYLYLPADAAEDRPTSAAEWTIDAEWNPSPRWTVEAGARYDVANDRPARVRVGLGWRNECVEVDLSAERRYTSLDSVEPSTDFGLSINLNGFSAPGQAAVPPGACRD